MSGYVLHDFTKVERVWLAPLLDAQRLIGLPPGWHGLSLHPDATALAALSLILPAALFLGIIRLDAGGRRSVAVCVVAVAGISVFLGLAQVADNGQDSALYFFEITNRGDSVGFFANRNHFAALMYVAVVLASVWAINAILDLWKDGERAGPGPAVVLTASLALMVTFSVAQIVARSRAGAGLAAVGWAGIALLLIQDRRNQRRGRSLLALAGIGVTVLLFASQFGLGGLLERFDPIDSRDARLIAANAMIDKAPGYLPFGSGMATFRPVYAMIERREDLLANTYINQGHNDLLQIWLEAGYFGVGALALFALCYVHRSFRVWWKSDGTTPDADLLLARAAAFAILLLLAHSLVDYPLRTSAGMAMFAICCALICKPVRMPPPGSGGSSHGRKESPRRSVGTPLVRRRNAPQTPAIAPRRAPSWS